jgi:hypothetical protein
MLENDENNDAGSGTLRSLNGSKHRLVYPHVLQETVLQNCPVNKSLTILPLRAKKFSHMREAFSPMLLSCSFPSSNEYGQALFALHISS